MASRSESQQRRMLEILGAKFPGVRLDFVMTNVGGGKKHAKLLVDGEHTNLRWAKSSGEGEPLNEETRLVMRYTEYIRGVLSIRAVEDLVRKALQLDDVKHKQWCLQRIAEKLECDVQGIEIEEGIEP